ncbi:MAG: hypothetical protein CMH55_05070 [Myxococcales bacterium]|nr:hypothetical protein [Myxococcales bacterium]
MNAATATLAPPRGELSWSPAAQWVGEEAARLGLLVSQFEAWEPPPTPAHWLPEGRPDLTVAPRWQRGVLVEGKYQAHTHDRRIASYHPGYRAKWMAHEYLHGIVGFAWHPEGSDFFHALAAWQAEILPVAIWYFHDEYGLRRCPEHQGGGPLFRVFCAACETVAGDGPLAPSNDDRCRWYEAGRAFVEEQLAGVRASVKAGDFEARPWASLDLASDGTAYAQAQSGRLESEAFRRFMDLFPPPADSLEAFEARILQVLDALEQGHALDEPGSDWRARDLCWRLLSLWSDCEGEVREHILDLAQQQAQGFDQFPAVLAAYRQLHEDWYLPEADGLFAVGYPLGFDGLGRSIPRVRAGLASVCPLTLEAADPSLIQAFASQDGLERSPLVQRFQRFLERQDVGAELGELMAMEARAARLARGGEAP